MLDSTITQFIAEQQERITGTEPHIAFSAEEYASRLTRLQRAMAEDGIDTLVLSSPEAQNWLHGLALRWYKANGPTDWRPLTCTVVRADAGYILFEGVEHSEMIRRTSAAEDVRLLPRYERDGMLRFIVKEIASEGWVGGSVVGLEMFSAIPNPAVSKMMEGALLDAGARVVDGTLTSRRVRLMKSPAELEAVKKAAEICDAGLLHLGSVLRPGMTELEAHGELIRGLSAAGGEPAGLHQVAFVGLAALGVYHEISGHRIITEDDFLDVDPCGVYKRYHSNRSQMYTFKEPPQGAVDLLEVLTGGFDILTERARPGVRIGDVNAELYAYYRDAGVFDLNSSVWIGGYEMGIAFPPDWVGEWKFTVVGGEDDDRVFEAGTVANFESMCGIGLLDTFVIEEDSTHLLSKLPHEIMVVGQ
ncbi:aminopeptidase P family protein [Leucobacter sp. CSA1]|uniref:Aminopeptidase P family protein n=1 Tax=Leucobacter chromiisoli TaxID=2796471 RepID=A0A934UTF0_9MICO|nr:Xaa-Pro peptidase family protein [Leucobacter chromiisoli]MBK0417650.1 aminopeptidase P family protein [Leucobacter chromiisoli]